MAVQSNRFASTASIVVVGERAHVRSKTAIDAAVPHLQRALELMASNHYAKRAAIRRRVELALDALGGTNPDA